MDSHPAEGRGLSGNRFGGEPGGGIELTPPIRRRRSCSPTAADVRESQARGRGAGRDGGRAGGIEWGDGVGV